MPLNLVRLSPNHLNSSLEPMFVIAKRSWCVALRITYCGLIFANRKELCACTCVYVWCVFIVLFFCFLVRIFICVVICVFLCDILKFHNSYVDVYGDLKTIDLIHLIHISRASLQSCFSSLSSSQRKQEQSCFVW